MQWIVSKDEWKDMRGWVCKPCVKAEIIGLISYTNRMLGSHNSLFTPYDTINRKLQTQ